MRILLLLIFVFFNQVVYAQSQDSLEINKNQVQLTKTLSEVVVTGQVTEIVAEDAINKVRVINSKILNSGLFQDLGGVLEKELNIRLSTDNVLGSSISMQGISGQNVKILIDDIPVIGRLNGNIDLSQISLNNIERIEIIEGPLSTIYGTDALAGTVNIITKKDLEHTTMLSTYYESIGKYNFDLMLGKKYKSNLITYQFQRKYFNGWSEGQHFSLIPASNMADTNRYKQWKPKQQFLHRLDCKFKKNNYYINSYIEGFYEKITNLGTPRQPYLENAFDEYYYTYRKNIGTDIIVKKKKKKIRILLAYNTYKRIKRTLYKDLTNLSSTLVKDPSAQDTTYFDLLIAKAILSKYDSEKYKYQLGIDFQYQSANGQRILDNYQKQFNYAIFSTIEYQLNDIISIRPSSRFIYNTNYKAPFIPSLNILFNFNNYSIRASYAKGFRAPDFKELFLNFVDINHNITGNNLLLSEKSDNYTINTSFKNNLGNAKISSEFSLFYNIISNKIGLYSLAENPEEYSYFNVENFITKGLSENIKISLQKLELNLGASYIGAYSALNTIGDNTKLWNFSINYNANAIFTLDTKTKINVFYNNIGKTPYFKLENEIITKSFSDSYSLLDISLNRIIYNDLITLTLGAKNLFDVKSIKRYQDNNSVHASGANNISIGYGRTFFAQLNFRL